MKLIIGGAFQGKKKYAQEIYQIEAGWADGASCSLKDLEHCRGVFHFHELIKRMVLGGAFEKDSLLTLEQSASNLAEQLLRTNPDLVIVSNELGYGVVPMEKTDRMWREAVGRICTELAARSDEVVRVVCGVGMRLK